MCLNQRGDISTLSDSSLKQVDKFIYQGSSVSSAETDINTRLAQERTALGRLSVIWKSDLADEKKTQFLQSSSRIDTTVWMHYMDANKTYGEKARLRLHKNAVSNNEKVLEAAPTKKSAVRPLTNHD